MSSGFVSGTVSSSISLFFVVVRSSDLMGIGLFLLAISNVPL